MNELKPINFYDIWDLFESQFTCELYNRHVDALNHIVRLREKGIIPSELPEFGLLIRKCRENILELNRTEFIKPLCDLVLCTLQPFVKEKSFQEITNYDLIIENLQLVGSLIDLKDTVITFAVCKGLQRFVNAPQGYNLTHDESGDATIDECYEHSVQYHAIADSQILHNLIESLKTWVYQGSFAHNNNDEYKFEIGGCLIQTFLDMSYNRSCAVKMLKLGILELTPLFDVTSETNQFMTREEAVLSVDDINNKKIEPKHSIQKIMIGNSIELLWNIIEMALSSKSDTNECELLIEKYLTLDFVNMLCQNAAYFLCHGYSIAQKQTRNCIFTIFLYLSKFPRLMHFFNRSKIIDIILQYCNNDTSCYKFKPFSMTNSMADYDMLVSMLCIIESTCHSYRVLSKIIQYNTVPILMKQYFLISGRETIQMASIPTSPLKTRSQVITLGSEMDESEFGTITNEQTQSMQKTRLSLEASGLILSHMVDRLVSPPQGKSAKLQENIVSNDFDPAQSLQYPPHATVKPLDNFSWGKTHLEQLRMRILAIIRTLTGITPKFFINTHYYIPQLIRFFVLYHQTRHTTDKFAHGLLQCMSWCMHYIVFHANKSPQYGLDLSQQSEALEQIDSACDREFSDLMLELILDSEALNHEKHEIKLEVCRLVLSVAYLSDAFKIQFGKDWIPALIASVSQLSIVPYNHDLIISLLVTARSLIQPKDDKSNFDEVVDNQECFFQNDGLVAIAILCDNLCCGQATEAAVSSAHSTKLREDGTVNYDYLKVLKTCLDTFLSLESNPKLANKLCEVEYSARSEQPTQNVINLIVMIWDHCRTLDTLETNPMSETSRSVTKSIRVATHCLLSVIDTRKSFHDKLNQQTPQNRHKLNQIKYYGELEEGKMWQNVENECEKQKIKLVPSDREKIEKYVSKYLQLEDMLRNEAVAVKQAEDTEVLNELKDLAKSLNAMKLREMRESTGKVRKKRVTSMKSKIKLTKDERDAMVAKSLQVDATIKKILNI